MRIAIHDFAGHPFQVQLSRELAGRGHSVLHLYLRELPGPKGRLERSFQDPATFECAPVSLGAPFEKYSMLKRHFSHRKYGRVLAERILAFRPDVVLSANTPIDVQHYLLERCQQTGTAFVHWMQDLYCRALRSVLTQKLGACALPLANHYECLERRVCARSGAVVFITPDFQTATAQMNFRPARSAVIENWAPLDDVVVTHKQNAWSARHGLAGKLVYLYSGTLGLKHKPDLLYRLAAALEGSDALVVVVSEGLGRTHLDQLQQRARLRNLLLLDFQPYAEMSSVFGAADVLLGILDGEAGVFAVPSKILSYLCAGRAILLAAPKNNLAARTVIRAEAGVVADPEDVEGFIRGAKWMAGEPELRRTFAENARRYAVTAFDIHAIAAQFESVLREAVEATARRQHRTNTHTPAYSRVAAG